MTNGYTVDKSGQLIESHADRSLQFKYLKLLMNTVTPTRNSSMQRPSAIKFGILLGVLGGCLIGPSHSQAKTESSDELAQRYHREEQAGIERSKAWNLKGESGAIHALKAHELTFDLCFNSKLEIGCQNVISDVHAIRDAKLKRSMLDLHLKKFKFGCENLESFYCAGLASTYQSLKLPELALETSQSMCEKNPKDGCLSLALEMKERGRTDEAHRHILRACEAEVSSCVMGLRYFASSPDIKRFEERAKADCPSGKTFHSCDVLGIYQLTKGRISEARDSLFNGCLGDYRACWLAAALDLRLKNPTSALAALKRSCNLGLGKPSAIHHQKTFSDICSKINSSGKISPTSRESINTMLDWFIREQT